MIRTLIFSLFTVFALSAPLSWTGQWFVVSQSSTNYRMCDVPLNNTVVNITSNDAKSLMLQGLGANSKVGQSWYLEWNSSTESGSMCVFEHFCLNGTLSTQGGVTYANLTWNTQDSSMSTCSVLLTPLQMSWAGNWFVVGSGEDRSCPAPKNMSPAKIEDFGDQLLLIAYETDSSIISSWTLNWTNTETQVRGACTGSICALANLNVDNWLFYGQIQWVAYSFWDCNVTLVRVENVSFDSDGQISDDLLDLVNNNFVQETLNTMPIINNYINLDQALMVESPFINNHDFLGM